MKSFFAIVFLLVFSALHAQPLKKDSLYTAIQKAGSDSAAVSRLKLELGVYYFKEGIFDTATQLLNECAAIAKKSGNHLTYLRAINNLGNVESDKGNNTQALKLYQQALTLAEEQNIDKETGEIQKNIGALYVSWKRFDEGIAFYNKAKETAIKQGNKLLEADCYNNIGIVYEQQIKYPEALAMYKKALDYYTASGNKSRIAMALSNTAIVYKYLKKYPEAVEYNMRGLAMAKEMQSVWTEAAILNNIGAIYTMWGKYDSANRYCYLSLEAARKITAQEIIYNVYENLGDIASAQGDYKLAIQHYKSFAASKDSFINAENSRELTELQARFETVQKDKQIAAQQFELARRKQFLVTLFALLVLGAALAYNYYRRFKLKKEKQLQDEVLKQQDMAVKAVLQAEEKERKRIAGELHDGVGQLMSAARMNLSAYEQDTAFADVNQKIKFEKIISLVDEGCREVRAVSHNMMPNALLKNGLANAVRDFVDKIDSNVIKVDLYSEGLNERLDANIETVLYRVIQECVNNVIKHSKANHLDISLIRDNNEISVTIEDNGVGFDVANKEKSEGIGLKNILTRVHYLKGEVDFDSTPGRGTLIAIHVPILP